MIAPDLLAHPVPKSLRSGSALTSRATASCSVWMLSCCSVRRPSYSLTLIDGSMEHREMYAFRAETCDHRSVSGRNIVITCASPGLQMSPCGDYCAVQHLLQQSGHLKAWTRLLL
jgi:hypothetical protein